MIYLWVMLALNPTACDADLNRDGFVTSTDFLILRGFLNQPCIPVPRQPDILSEDGAVLTWRSPARNTDDTPLLDLIGYKVYCSNLVFDVVAPPWLVDNTVLTQPMTCSVTAINSKGDESQPSNSITF